MTGWTSILLGQVCTKIGSGATPRGGSSVYLSAGDVALIRSQNVYNEGFRRDGLAFITPEHARELDQVEVMPGDVLLNITGDSVARCCQVNESILPARVNQHVAIIRPDPQKLDPRFLRYFLVSPDTQSQMLSWAASGGTRNALTKGMIESFVIFAPEHVAEQRAIAHILGTLDDKIELNRRMNETLEAMARAIFKSWFVDFDPVRAKMERRWKRGQSLPGLPADTFDLWPDSFQDSPLGKIPKGWRIGTLGEIAENPRRGVQPNKILAGTPYIGLEHMPKKTIALSDWGHADQVASNKFAFKQGEILFGKLRPYFYKVGVAVEEGVCSTDILVIRPKSEEWYGHVLSHVSGEDFITYADAVSTGTKMPRTNWPDMARYELFMPDPQTADAYNQFTMKVVAMIRQNILQSRTLAAIRDALLPKLVSGEIRVKHAEKLMEETA